MYSELKSKTTEALQYLRFGLYPGLPRTFVVLGSSVLVPFFKLSMRLGLHVIVTKNILHATCEELTNMCTNVAKHVSNNFFKPL